MRKIGRRAGSDFSLRDGGCANRATAVPVRTSSDASQSRAAPRRRPTEGGASRTRRLPLAQGAAKLRRRVTSTRAHPWRSPALMRLHAYALLIGVLAGCSAEPSATYQGYAEGEFV